MKQKPKSNEISKTAQSEAGSKAGYLNWLEADAEAASGNTKEASSRLLQNELNVQQPENTSTLNRARTWSTNANH